ncbi:PEP/pyruvate-binding domain-containing protein [Legionella gresilensis]
MTHTEKLFGWPQNIEWLIDDGKFYILQSRDITTKII